MGLMYLKSNNTTIANRLSIPNTNYLLDSIRPDFLLLRVLCKNLILWDSVLPTNAWIMSQIPDAISHAISNNHANLMLTQAHVCLLAGTCFVIGLKFAGSLHVEPFKLLLSYLDYLVNLKGYISDDATLSIIETCICTVACSVSFVMAGSGDLHLLQILRKLRQRVHGDITYGNYMAIHMAIGILYLGDGRYSLTTDNMAIASLLIAFYPQFPSFTSDNRYHLQALRHLYVLALEKRCVEACDVDTNQQCMVQLEVLLKETTLFKETKINVIAPCILPEWKFIKSIRVSSPRYVPQIIDMMNPPPSFSFQKILFIKRKAAFMNYSRDPKGDKSILSRSFPKHSQALSSSYQNRKQKAHGDFLQAFSTDPYILAFMNYFCNNLSLLQNDGANIDPKFLQFSTLALYECLTEDKLDMLATYFHWYTLILKRNESKFFVLNYNMIQKYYSTFSQNPLISLQFLECIQVLSSIK
jgi:anaphase-promoting complex subunit 1